MLKDIILQNEKIQFIDNKYCIDGKPASGAVGGTNNGFKVQVKLDNGVISASREFISENHCNHTEYHPNGEVSYKCTYIDNKKVGEYFYYDIGGSVTTKGTFKNDKPYGEQVNYFAIYTNDSFNYAPANEDGTPKIRSVRNYNEGGQEHGEFREYYSNGNEKYVSNYVNGNLQGMERFYDIEGNIISKKTYENNLINGEILEYHHKQVDDHSDNLIVIKNNDGKPSLREKCFRNMGNLEGPYESYYENGFLEKKGNYENNLMVGSWTFDNIDGTPSKSLTYKNGKKEGFFSTYMDSFLEAQGYYVNDRVDGELKVFYETGELKSSQDHVDGIPKKVTFFYKDGKIKSTQSYVGGQIEGVVETFYETGELESRSNYRMGKKDGLYEKFNKEGSLLKSIKYMRDVEVDGKNYDDYGNLLSTYEKDRENITNIDYYLDGKIKKKAVDSFKLQDEIIEEFYPNGVLKSTKRVKYNVNSKGVRIADFGSGDKDGDGLRYGEYKEYHIIGNPKIIATYENDKLVGKYQRFYENGNLDTELVFGPENEKIKREFFHYNGKRSAVDWLLNKKVVGPCGFYHENGELSAIENKDDDGYIQGEVKTFTKDGILSGEYNYLNGFKTNDLKTYFPNGSIEREHISENHILKYERYYHPNGNLREENHHKAPTYKDCRFFYGDGTLKEFYSFKKGVKHGENRTYNPEGTMVYSDNFVDGVLEGPTTLYYDNGQKRTEFFYKKGVREGLHKSWFEDGTLSNCFPYKNGEHHGEWKRFYNSGNIEISANYIEDNLHGKYEEFHDNGNKRVVCYYKHGVIIGDKYEYDEDENLVAYSFHYERDSSNNIRYEFFGDRRVKKIVNGLYGQDGYRYKEFYSNGELKSVYIQGKEGENDSITEFYENGNIRVTTKADCRTIYRENGKFDTRFYLKNNKIHGDHTLFGKNNNPIVITYYENGKAHGKQYKYFENGDLKQMSFFYDGKPHSRSYSYYPSVKIKSFERFWDGGGIAEARKEYFESGKISSEFVENEKDKTTFYMEYYEDGQTKKRVQVAYKGSHHYIGKYEEFYQNGKAKSLAEYRGGLLSGRVLNYYRSGGKRDEAEYQEGVMVSDRIGFYPDGTRKSEEIINEDNQVVMIKRYSMDGNISTIEYYRYGKLVDNVELFYPSGKKYGLIPIVEGVKDGRASYYYEDGPVSLVEHYEEGYIHGDVIEYYKDGVIKSRCEYIYGKLEGDKTFYTPEGRIEKIVFFNDGKEVQK